MMYCARMLEVLPTQVTTFFMEAPLAPATFHSVPGAEELTASLGLVEDVGFYDELVFSPVLSCSQTYSSELESDHCQLSLPSSS